MLAKEQKIISQRRLRRKQRVRSRIRGTAQCPRLTVQRSLRGMYVQLIDDTAGKTIVAMHTKTASLSADAGERTGRVAKAYVLGKAVAEQAKAMNVTTAVFDRSGYAYHGQVQALAEGARDGGLTF